MWSNEFLLFSSAVYAHLFFYVEENELMCVYLVTYTNNWSHMLFMPCVPWNADGYGYGSGNYDGGYSGGRGGARGKGTHYSVLFLPWISYLSSTGHILSSIIFRRPYSYFLMHINCIHLHLFYFILFFFRFSQSKKFHLSAFSSSSSLAVHPSLEYLFSLLFALFVP